MGYTTDFAGQFKLDRPMDAETADALTAFATQRFGPQQQGELGLEYSYYCQWELNDDCTAIRWDGGEKFYDYITWLKILIDRFIAPNGYVLNGIVQWSGEDLTDVGRIVVKDNNVSTVGPSWATEEVTET